MTPIQMVLLVLMSVYTMSPQIPKLEASILGSFYGLASHPAPFLSSTHDFRSAVFFRLSKSRRAAGVQTWRYRSLESRYRCSDVEESRYGALMARCKCTDVEV